MWNIKSSESFLTDPDGRSRWFDGCHEYIWPPSCFWIYPQGGTVGSEMGIMEWNGCKHFVYCDPHLCVQWNIKSSESFLTDPDGRSRWFDGCHEYMWPPSYFWIYPQGGTVAVEWNGCILHTSYFWIYPQILKMGVNILHIIIKSSESFLTDPDGRSRWFDGCHEYMWPPSYFWIYPQGGTVAYYGVKWV